MATEDDECWEPSYRVGRAAVAWTLRGALECRAALQRTYGTTPSIYLRDTGEVVTRSMIDRLTRQDEILGEPSDEMKRQWYESKTRSHREGSETSGRSSAPAKPSDSGSTKSTG